MGTHTAVIGARLILLCILLIKIKNSELFSLHSYVFEFENKELEVKGHARDSPLILGLSEGVQNVVNKSTEFMYGELHYGCTVTTISGK